MLEAKELGRRVANFRERLELSQEALAVNSGLNRELVASIEDGQIYPPIGILLKLSRALGQRLGTFMDDHFREDPLIVRAAERQSDLGPRSGKAEGYRYFPLGRGKTDRHMEPLFVELPASVSEAASSHEGEEFIVVVDGEVELSYGKDRHVLKAGDSMYYNSIVPHSLRALNDRSASLYAVIFQPF